MAKRFIALFVLAMFIVGMVPAAFAVDATMAIAAGYDGTQVAATQVATANIASATLVATGNSSENGTVSGSADSSDGTDEDSSETTDSTTGGRLRKGLSASVANSERLRPMLANAGNATRQQIRARITNQVELYRNVTKQKLEQARDRYQQARENYLTVRTKYLEKKSLFTKAKDDYRQCKDSETDDCKKKRNELMQKAQPHFSTAADLVLKELERVKELIQASEDLSDDEIASMVAEIDTTIQEVEDAKATIDNLDENSTREEINDAAKTIREAWQDAKMRLKRHLGRLANAKLGNIILKTETLEKRLYNIKDKLEAKGYDTSALDSKLEEFSAKLDTAAQKYNEARSKWSGANTPADVDKVAKEVNKLLIEAHSALKDARDLLRDIVNEIKKLNNGSLEVDTSAEAGDESASGEE